MFFLFLIDIKNSKKKTIFVMNHKFLHTWQLIYKKDKK
jgi:hypothetical protein